MKKIMLGMSGGVDSSVAALLLTNAGYDVTGVTLRLRPDRYMEQCVSGGCCYKMILMMPEELPINLE